MPGQMSKGDSSRIQFSQAKSGGDMSSSGFAARAQSAADRSGNFGGGASGNSNSGGGRGSGNGSSGAGNNSSGQTGGNKK
ncbi:hypothetical protein ONS95_000133 [Cadophora gregata]|uniref:uncharacterized protein n=1 Tax=Cadophora gregata TaxID=51156 RepID=UPI0026DD381F|nr:uncharacterized protein ONS95_000133 [Cadophora gregata]KAK0115594.1 hypothetical protein ONS96_014044 [Cadophora gregata f. sp. sojae]KAK0128150.1 hypothetical protein ONS95_000133 [Cadophora gregata]